jgi:hypothetical protein
MVTLAAAAIVADLRASLDDATRAGPETRAPMTARGPTTAPDDPGARITTACGSTQAPGDAQYNPAADAAPPQPARRPRGDWPRSVPPGSPAVPRARARRRLPASRRAAAGSADWRKKAKRARRCRLQRGHGGDRRLRVPGEFSPWRTAELTERDRHAAPRMGVVSSSAARRPALPVYAPSAPR